MSDAARVAALEVLTAVRAQDAYANLALPAALRRHGLEGRDAGFATELASGTIRLQGTYDAVLVACLVAGPVAALAIALLGLVLLVVMLAACG